MLQNIFLLEKGTQCHGCLYTHTLVKMSPLPLHLCTHAHLHSLAAFIASDTEEVESDSDDGHNENHTPWKVPLATPSYSTSDTPYTRVAFCGSPDMDGNITTKPTTQLHPLKPICTPLGERNHTYYSTPVAGWHQLGLIPKPCGLGMRLELSALQLL